MMILLDELEQEHVIKGSCHGVVLSRRGLDDPHVIVTPIAEDDGNWFTTDTGFSSTWLPEYIVVMEEALMWIAKHCGHDPSGFGYVFREPGERSEKT